MPDTEALVYTGNPLNGLRPLGALPRPDPGSPELDLTGIAEEHRLLAWSMIERLADLRAAGTWWSDPGATAHNVTKLLGAFEELSNLFVRLFRFTDPRPGHYDGYDADRGRLVEYIDRSLVVWNRGRATRIPRTYSAS